MWQKHNLFFMCCPLRSPLLSFAYGFSFVFSLFRSVVVLFFSCYSVWKFFWVCVLVPKLFPACNEPFSGDFKLFSLFSILLSLGKMHYRLDFRCHCYAMLHFVSLFILCTMLSNMIFISSPRSVLLVCTVLRISVRNHVQGQNIFDTTTAWLHQVLILTSHVFEEPAISGVFILPGVKNCCSKFLSVAGLQFSCRCRFVSSSLLLTRTNFTRHIDELCFFHWLQFW